MSANNIRDAVTASGGSFYNWLATTDIGSLGADVAKITSDLSALREQVVNSVREIDSLTTQVLTLGQTYQSFERKIDTEVSEIRTLINDLKSSVDDKINDFNTRISAFDKQLENLLSEFDIFRTSVNKGIDAIEKMTVKIDSKIEIALVDSVASLKEDPSADSFLVKKLPPKQYEGFDLPYRVCSLAGYPNFPDARFIKKQFNEDFSWPSYPTLPEQFWFYETSDTLVPSKSISEVQVLSGVIRIVDNAREEMMTSGVIRIENRPHQTTYPPGVFSKSSDVPDDLEDGAFVSELGSLSLLPTWRGSIAGWQLRPSRIRRNTRPFNPFGKMSFGTALSSPEYEVINIPAVGSTTIYTPPVSGLLGSQLNSYTSYVRADVTYILYVPVPLGYSQVLRIYAPEIDESTKTRGVIWKPGASPSLAVANGWRHPQVVQATLETQIGRSGLSIAIETIEDNSADSLATPIQMIIYSFVHNVEGYAWNKLNPVVLPPMKFSPVATSPTPPRTLEFTREVFGFEQADSEASALGDTPGMGVSLSGQPTVEATSVDVVKPVPAPSVESGSKAGSTANAAAPQQKWHKLSVISFALETDVGQAKTVSLTPYTLAGNGDGIFRPFNRNVWCAPSRIDNRLAGLEWRVVSNRVPYFAALVEIRSNELDFSYDSVLHEVGGAPTTIFGMPSFLCDPDTPRATISPWVKCPKYTESISLRMLVRNFTQDRSAFSVTVFVRPGKMRFNVPTKPQRRAKQLTVLGIGDIGDRILNLGSLSLREVEAEEQGVPTDENDERWQAFDDYISDKFDGEGCSGAEYNSLAQSFFAEDAAPGAPVPVGGDGSCLSEPVPEGAIAPPGDRGVFGGLMDTVTVPTEPFDMIDQSDFWIRAGDVTLVPNKVNSVLLDLSSAADVNSAGGDTPVTEFMNRYAEVSATKAGQYGPVVGQYFVKLRPPANITCDIEHVCIPPEMAEAVALRFFGLDSILSLAGSAISSLGGSLVDGAISTVGNVFGNLFGGSGSPATETPGVTSNPETTGNATTGGITGDIPITRFLEFISSFSGNTTANKTDESIWPNLLLKLVNYLPALLAADGDQAIPATIYVKANNMVGSRSTFERSNAFVPKVGLKNSIFLDQEQLSLFMYHVSMSDHPKAKSLLRKCFTVFDKRLKLSHFGRYDVTELESEEEASQEVVVRLLKLV